MAQKKAMGRGLSAILNEDNKQVHSAKEEAAKDLIGNVLEIDIDLIIPNPDQPRTHFDAKALEGLAQSIKELGIIQPITVRKNGSNYDLISGERRYRASKIVGLTKIPAFIRLADDVELLEMALVENTQREDLDPIEVALVYEKLIQDIQLTQEQLSLRVGKERSTITNYLRLLKLDPIIQSGIRDGMISMGHGKVLMSIELHENQLEAYHQILKNQWSVRQTELYVKSLKEPNKVKRSVVVDLPNEHKKGLKRLEDFFNQSVVIKRNSKGKGTITISFNSDEDFEDIQSKLL